MNLNALSPLQRAIGLVLFMVGFVWLMLGLGFFGGSVISGQTWAAVLGFLVLATGLYILTRRPKAVETDDAPADQPDDAPLP